MEIPRNWRLRQQRYSLVGEVCPDCETKIFPPRDICPDCGHEAKTEFKFSGRGVIYSFTTVYDPPAGFEEFVPYVVALVKLEEGPMITAMLTDLEMKWGPKEIDGEMREVGEFQVQIGMPVEMVTRILKKDGERGLIHHGYKFRPRIRDFTESEEGLIFKAQEAEVPVSY